MGSKRKRADNLPVAVVPIPLTPPNFKTLISSIQTTQNLQGLKVPCMKRLYELGAVMSSMESIDSLKGELGLKDVQPLIRLLFKELDRRLQIVFSALSDANENHKYMEIDIDELSLLLRCCIAFSMVDPDLVMENIQNLHFVLGKVIGFVTSGCSSKESFSIRRSLSSERTCTDGGGTYVSQDFSASLCFLKPSNPWYQLLYTLLEIFADELLVWRQLRRYLVCVDSAGIGKKLFNNHGKSDIASVLEVLSFHFILSVYDEPASQKFCKRLYLLPSNHSRGPELSLTAALPLLLNTVMLSMPKMLQAHLILLVSEAIDMDFCLKDARPDLRNMDSYLTAFETAVGFYTTHMSGSLKDHYPLGVSCSHTKSRSYRCSFESGIQEGTRDKICCQVTHLGSLRQLTESDLMAASIAYTSENQHIFDQQCQDDILLVLHGIIHGSSSSDVNHKILDRKGDISTEDIYLLASILKLMSSSLLKAIWCLRNGGDSGYPQKLKDASSLKQYESIVDTIDCFTQFNLSLSNQKFLSDLMKTRPMIHKTSKWILLHFLGVLSLSFASGIDFLAKGCISVIIAILNLCAYEEGEIAALRSFYDVGSQSVSSGLPPDRATQPAKKLKFIRKVASTFQKNQSVYLRESQRHHKREECLRSCTTEFTDAIEEEIEETCNGEAYLNSVEIEKPDLEDLADFIVCEPGKDYSSWLKNRGKYRSWKLKQDAVVRWEKKKKTYRRVMK